MGHLRFKRKNIVLIFFEQNVRRYGKEDNNEKKYVLEWLEAFSQEKKCVGNTVRCGFRRFL